MGQKKSLDEKRLTKKQVQELIKTEGNLHQEFTKFFEETYPSGYKHQPLVYELSNDRFLFIFDPNEGGIGGKGDIYPKDYFLRKVRWTQKVRDDYANNRGSSVEHWRHYSKHKADLINRIDQLVDELAKCLEISRDHLNFSYVSLDAISNKTERYGLEKAQDELYNNLVAYVGEVIRCRSNGRWGINDAIIDQGYPCIIAGRRELSPVVLMPINVVWCETDGLEPMDLRKEAANEMRRFALRQH